MIFLLKTGYRLSKISIARLDVIFYRRSSENSRPLADLMRSVETDGSAKNQLFGPAEVNKNDCTLCDQSQK